MHRSAKFLRKTEISDDVVGPELKKSDLQEGYYVFSVMLPLFFVASNFKSLHTISWY